MQPSAVLELAIEKTNALMEQVEHEALIVDLEVVPPWVREFFHERTLSEVLAAFQILKRKKDYFLTACLLGILHHVRPGFLSFPASHLVPYLRKAKYPPDEFPQMYSYRDLRSRLIAKVRRAYRSVPLQIKQVWDYRVWQTNSMSLPISDHCVDAIISSPPYFGALDYARDNRLRLWFIGCEDWKKLDRSLTANHKVYLPQMRECLVEMHRVLKPNAFCILVLGDVESDGKTHRTAEILAEQAVSVTHGQFCVDTIYDDVIPDERRSRRKTRTTKFDRILVMRKQA